MTTKIEGLTQYGATAQMFALAETLQRSPEAREMVGKILEQIARPERYSNEHCDQRAHAANELTKLIRGA